MPEDKKVEKTVEQIDAEIAALAEERKKMLEETKATDLELVKKLCKQHGFTATNLRGALKDKAKKSTLEVKKPAAKKTTTKSK
jgi:hypothetical protein